MRSLKEKVVLLENYEVVSYVTYFFKIKQLNLDFKFIDKNNANKSTDREGSPYQAIVLNIHFSHDREKRKLDTTDNIFFRSIAELKKHVRSIESGALKSELDKIKKTAYVEFEFDLKEKTNLGVFISANESEINFTRIENDASDEDPELIIPQFKKQKLIKETEDPEDITAKRTQEVSADIETSNPDL